MLGCWGWVAGLSKMGVVLLNILLILEMEGFFGLWSLEVLRV
jgi:hypothetical protein